MMDDRGILGMPFKLAISVIVLAALVPVIAQMVDDAEDRITLTDSEKEVQKLIDGIERTYYMSVGSRMTVDVSFHGGEHIEVGGDGGYTIRVLKDDVLKQRIVLDSPYIRIFGDTQRISGDVSITITHVVEDGINGVRIGI